MKSVRRLTGAALMAAVLSASLVACGPSDDDAEGEVVGEVDKGEETEVRQAGDELKIVALGWSDGEIAASLGVDPIAIYDWQGFGEENKGVGSWAADDVADADIEVIENTGGDFNTEQIELLEPDLILNVRGAANDAVFDSLSKIAPVATAPDGTGDFAVDWKTQTEIIAKAIGKEDEAADLIAETEKVITDAAAANPQFADKTFNYVAKFNGQYSAYLPGDARFDVFGELGFVADEDVSALAPSGFYAAVPADNIAVLESDAAIFTTIGSSLSDLTSDPLVNALSVVTEGRSLMLEETDEAIEAISAGTPKSIALAVETLAPQLAEIVPAS